MQAGIELALSEAGRVLAELQADDAQIRAAARAGLYMAGVLSAGGRVMAAGNGGSMADAMHFCEELTGRFRKDRRAYAAIPLSDPTHLSCTANDYGFEQVFSRLVQAYGRSGDVLLLLSTSGQSPNLLRAAEQARGQDVWVIGLLGRGGGSLAPFCHEAILVPGETSDRIQELHMLLLHAMIEGIERELGHA